MAESNTPGVGSSDGPSDTTDDSKASLPSSCDYTIGGVKVRFPCRAYSSQVAMMGKVITSLQRGQNSLIESPTGSGKTLALLCSAIAWQRTEAERLSKLAVAEHEEKLKERKERNLKKKEKQREREQKMRQRNAETESFKSVRKRAGEALASPVVKKADGGVSPEVIKIPDSDDDDDFVSVPKPRQKHQGQENRCIPIAEGEASGSPSPAKIGGMKITVCDEESNDQLYDSENEDPLMNDEEYLNYGGDGIPPMPKIRIPKIYFGTRTHKQIEQVVRELKKTAYSDIRMTILSSREHTCLQNKPRTMASKTELCHELLEQAEKKTGPGCMYHRNVRTMANHHALKNSGLPTPWDLEDIIKVGKRIRCCPYFAARELMGQSEIILCPYSYLISPMIRKNVDIHLRGEVIILDEAHNMEDAAREAASMSLDIDTVRDAMDDCEKTGRKSTIPDSYAAFSQFLSILGTWMDKTKDSINDYRDFNQASQVWTGTQLSAIFSNLGIGEDRFAEMKAHLKMMDEAGSDEMTDEWDDQGTSNQKRSMSAATKTTLEGLFLILENIIGSGKSFRDDYRIALVRSLTRDYRSPGEENGWLQSRRVAQSRWKLTLNFWCLNAAVAFNGVSQDTRSIVLTSGTLAPVNSFQSELGTPFPIRLEANHVIDKSQVYVATVGFGPNNYSLNATFRNAETFDFQDEIGKVVLDVCKVVPHGVLCFLPSYNMLEKLVLRWQTTGLEELLSSHKVLLHESRGRGGEEFEQTLREFYHVVENTSIPDPGGPTGPLLLAVCRGKVSEGLDFADNNARAVISVGIPYPNFKDTQVELKRQYNNAHSGNRGLLSGSDWYEIQAFRALNQALGRCIRHRNDWGAIILLDDRFSKNQKYTQGLSKWIKNMVYHYPSWDQMYAGLGTFMQRCTKSSAIGSGSSQGEMCA
ncbi:Fanconi anemia group J protein homolog [Hetaerina americana]|uniref:Fanconi anemia group J protein homolog n=1 Tax=Hetaerina americana TaxID=62018 RepID=UPI003A7F13EE